MKTEKPSVTKEALIAECLAGDISFRELGTKYGVNFRKINKWVLAYQGREKKRPNSKIKTKQSENPLPVEVKQLQAELRKAQLHNKLLEAMIDIGKEQYGVDLRKKPGTRQS